MSVDRTCRLWTGSATERDLVAGAGVTGLGWAAAAACRGVDPNVFFQEEDGGVSAGGRPKARRVALAYCAGCPVLDDCRAWALRNDEEFGVWGGVAHWKRGNRRERLDLLRGVRR